MFFDIVTAQAIMYLILNGNRLKKIKEKLEPVSHLLLNVVNFVVLVDASIEISNSMILLV